MNDALYVAVAAAIQAPSSHNTQPWRFKINGASLEIHLDPSRLLPVIDAERRQQIESCGCALYNARLAVRVLGFNDHVTTMFVDGGHPDHLATLSLGGMRIATHDDHEMYAAIARRHTNRRDFLPRPIGNEIFEVLAAAAAREGARLVRLVPDQKQALGGLVENADQRQYADPAFRAELARWLVAFGSRRRDGIPFSEKEYGSALPFTMMRTLRSHDLGNEFGALEHEHVAHAPAVVVLGTESDDPVDWLACGQALEAVLLRATTLGLSASFLNQVLELPDLRTRLAELVPEAGYPQMVLRVGVPVDSVRHAAPRRDIAEVMIA